MRTRTKEDGEALEGLIDRYGLSEVIDWISETCSAKADHVMHNWQDRTLAVRWQKASHVLDKARASLPELP